MILLSTHESGYIRAWHNSIKNHPLATKAYRNPQAPEVNYYYVGLTFYLFQVFPNPMREFIFTDVTPSDANNGLILVFR